MCARGCAAEPPYSCTYSYEQIKSASEDERSGINLTVALNQSDVCRETHPPSSQTPTRDLFLPTSSLTKGQVSVARLNDDHRPSRGFSWQCTDDEDQRRFWCDTNVCGTGESAYFHSQWTWQVKDNTGSVSRGSRIGAGGSTRCIRPLFLDLRLQAPGGQGQAGGALGCSAHALRSSQECLIGGVTLGRKASLSPCLTPSFPGTGCCVAQRTRLADILVQGFFTLMLSVSTALMSTSILILTATVCSHCKLFCSCQKKLVHVLGWGESRSEGVQWGVGPNLSQHLLMWRKIATGVVGEPAQLAQLVQWL